MSYLEDAKKIAKDYKPERAKFKKDAKSKALKKKMAAKMGEKKFTAHFEGPEGLPMRASLTNKEINSYMKKNKGVTLKKKEYKDMIDTAKSYD